MKLVTICGKSGSGKDALANFIKSNCKRITVIDHWADPIKEMMVEHFGIERGDLYSQEGKSKFNDFWGMSIREILQRFGTDALREHFCQDVWVKIMNIRLEKYRKDGVEVVIIGDTRFNNEASVILKMGGSVVCIRRPEENALLNFKEKSHPSELGIDLDLITRFVENDGTLDDLNNESKILIKELKLEEE